MIDICHSEAEKSLIFHFCESLIHQPYALIAIVAL